MNTEIGVVVVTFNRLDKLKHALETFENQTFLPKYLIVVDNASTDGTGEYLKSWKSEQSVFEKIVISMRKNRGGSGGFYKGLKKGLDLSADWIWVSDDDAFPESDALEKAHKYLERNSKTLENISAICGQVLNCGKIDIAHRKIYRCRGIRITETFVPETEYNKKEFAFNAFTYVGTIMNKKKLTEAGLPNKDFFIWWDDLEHGLRMSKVGRILCVPEIKVHHDVAQEAERLSWKSYYGYRNMTATYKKHFYGCGYYFFCFKVWIKIIVNFVLGKRAERINVLQDGFLDALRNKFGIHPVYKPGWIPKENRGEVRL